MPIPIRCFACGKPLADAKNYFQQECNKRKMKENSLNLNYKKNEVFNVHADEIKKQIEAEVLDELGFIRECCRSNMMTFIDD